MKCCYLSTFSKYRSSPICLDGMTISDQSAFSIFLQFRVRLLHEAGLTKLAYASAKVHGLEDAANDLQGLIGKDR